MKLSETVQEVLKSVGVILMGQSFDEVIWNKLDKLEQDKDEWKRLAIEMKNSYYNENEERSYDLATEIDCKEQEENKA